MINKSSEQKNKSVLKNKYIIALLIAFYLTGIYFGCYYIFSKDITHFLNFLDINSINSAVYIILALLLKYSGIMSVLLYILPFFSGLQNSVLYCQNIINGNSNIGIVIKDTAVTMLLIIYITIIIMQIINKKYNIKKDVKYFSVYFCGVIIIQIISQFINSVIF